MTATLIKSRSTGQYGFSSLYRAGTSQPILIPADAGPLKFTLTPTGGVARIEYTLSSKAEVDAGAASWRAWPRGNVNAVSADELAGKVRAVRCVVGSGSATLQITEAASDLVVWNSKLLTNPLRPLSRDIAIFGDSRTANCHSGAAPNEIAENYGWASWLCQYTHGRVRISKAKNGGVGGDTSPMVLARISTILGYGADVYAGLLSTNDRGAANLSLATSKRNVEAICRKLIEAGKVVVIIAETPRGGSNALAGQQLANHLAMRDWIKSYLPTIGVRVADPWPELVDPASPVYAPRAGYFHDDLHPGPIAARIIGKHVAAQLLDLYPTRLALPLEHSAYDASTNVTGYLTSNSLCTGTGGTKNATANATGPLADGWNLVGSSFTGGTVTLSKEANPDGGEFQVFELGGMVTAASSYISFEQSISTANLANGNKIKAVAQVVHENLAGVCGVSLDIRFVRGGTAYYVKYADRYQDTTPMDGELVIGPQETPELAIDATETDVKVRLVIYGCQNIPMAGKVKVGQMAPFKVI